MLNGIDVMLFDIQDVGARPYTYVSTMAYVMEACAQYGKAMWVLDRPNPVGGVLIDGPVLEPKYKSFVGLYPIPERHGMTVGELARLFNEHFGIGCALHVVPMEGWTREMLWADTGLRWVPTSPNMPYARTTLVYLATGLVDEAGVNNGVGTDRPFEYAGGYGFDAAALRDALAARAIPGVEFEPADWSPLRGFWAGKTLRGVSLDVTDPHAFPSVRTALEILCAARAQGKFHVAHAVDHGSRLGDEHRAHAARVRCAARRDPCNLAARSAGVRRAAREVSALLMPRLLEWLAETQERLRAMVIVAGMTLPAFGVRPYQTRELKDVYGATDVPPEEPRTE